MSLAWSGVLSEYIDQIFPLVLPLLHELITTSPRGDTVETVKANLKAGTMQLWVVHDQYPAPPNIKLALVTEVHCHPDGKYVHCQFIAGKGLFQALPLFGVVIEWGKAQACDSILCYPRRGLAKVLRDTFGFQKVCPTQHGLLYCLDLISNPKSKAEWKISETSLTSTIGSTTDSHTLH